MTQYSRLDKYINAHHNAHMDTLYDYTANKKATNLSINSDLLKRARALKINLSATLETALAKHLAAEQAKQWKDENMNAIKAYNHHVNEHGLFAEDERLF